MARVFYRVGQFWQGLAAKVSPEDYQAVARVLPPAALPLFSQMPVDAQRHSLNVLYHLWATGHHHPDLAVAALLHDCGKVAAMQGGVSLGLWLRGPFVILDACFPRLAARLALSGTISSPVSTSASNPKTSPVRGWRYALYVQRHHAAIGAAWAKQAGCSPLSCWLIAHHQSPLSTLDGWPDASAESCQLLAILQEADDGN